MKEQKLEFDKDAIIRTLISEKLGVEIGDYNVKSFTTEGKRTKITIEVRPVDLQTYIDLNYSVITKCSKK